MWDLPKNIIVLGHKIPVVKNKNKDYNGLLYVKMKKGKKKLYIYINKYLTQEQATSTLIHEMFHAVNYIKNYDKIIHYEFEEKMVLSNEEAVLSLIKQLQKFQKNLKNNKDLFS